MEALKPYSLYRDSGLPWLGQVPERWQAIRSKYLFREIDDRTDTGTETLLSMRQSHGLIPHEEVSAKPVTPDELKGYPIVSSAGVIGTHATAMAIGPGVATGRYGSTGKIFYIEEDFWPHNTALYVSQFHGNLPRYVFYLLHTLRYEEHSDKSAVPGIDRKDLHDIRVAKASLDEQQKIVAALDDDLAELGEVIERIAAEIRLINEYRERLIADVVTGKLDVRHIEIATPADEPSLEDDDAPDEDLEIDDADPMEEADAGD